MSGPISHHLVQSLREVPGLGELPDASLLRVVAVCATLLWPAGARVYSAGEDTEAAYVVLGGVVRLTTDGREEQLREGDYFGVEALLGAPTHRGSAEAVEDSKLLVIPVAGVETLVETDPELARLRQELEGRLRS